MFYLTSLTYNNAAFTFSGFDDQQRNLMFFENSFPNFKNQISCLQYEADFLSTLQTKYCASLTTTTYFFRSFHFGTWLSNL